MERFNGWSLFVQNFKCFGAELQGFERVRRLYSGPQISDQALS